MFKKPNRKLRVRRAASSEEEEEERSQVERPKRPGGRGLTCGTKRRIVTASDEEEQEQQQDDSSGPSAAAASVLSFTEDREGEEISFKIRKPSVSTVVFKVHKKAEEADCTTKLPENDSGEDSQSEPEQSEPEDVDNFRKQEAPGSASSKSSASPPRPSQAGEIPDAKQIRAARKRRELARAQGDYISLNASQEASDSSQSDSDDELDDHEKRIKFAPGVRPVKERMAEEMASSSNSDSEREEADDLQDRWEEQQIRKAVKYPQPISEDRLRGDSPPQVRRRAEPKISTPLVTVEDIKKRLTSRIASIEEVHRSHMLDSERYSRDLESSKDSLEKLETSSSEQSFKFFKEMKIYVENFVDCLREKIQQINELEAEMFQILESRASILLKRRQDDLRNESVSIQKLAGNGVASDSETADSTALNQTEDCELRRRKRRQKREESGQIDHCEGMSSDDELQSDLEQDFQRQQEDISGQCKTIFEDVHEDFCQIKNVLSKFHKWRTRFPESYYDAYISLCLHKILSPLVRLQLIGWSPLEEAKDLEQMAWYNDLEEFCFSKDEHENSVQENADHKVLQAVIEKTLVPKASAFIELVWDPLSSRQTDRLVSFCKTHVLESESSKMVKALTSCLVSRLKKAIEDDVYIPLYPQRVLEDRSSPHYRFRERQFWSAVKLLGNVTSWDGFLEEETLQELALDKLLNRYLLLVILNAEPDKDMVTKCSTIVECLPQSWFKGLDGGSSLARLANFSKHLVQCVHAIHKLHDRDSMEVLVSLLRKVKAQDYVEEVTSKYSMGKTST
ncbi:intron Large complex component GCFC2 [Hyperolius riggenbachi]|uniref:intron Large complex component GCFC2 n=1 Tax=Hyperolius riggenbachi TaxID=752182 RepID=UPI0035A33785